MVKNFKEAKSYLESFIPTDKMYKHPGKLGLERTRYFLKLLGNPQKKFPCVHVTGTSGKGSTCYLIASFLKEAGFKTGLHISPHLEKITERIQINNQNISNKNFVNLINQVASTIEFLRKTRYGKPSYFEILAVLAFLAFAEEKIDIAVIEVGMGGRYDATNVIISLVAVITNIGLDHTQILGKTPGKIAQDKMQIIKKGTIAINGVKQQNVLKILKQHCRKISASLITVKNIAKIVSLTDQGTTFNLQWKNNLYNNLTLSLLGQYQVENASLAIVTAFYLTKSGYLIPEKAIREGLKNAFFPGRLEILNKNPLVVIDGAHNPEKIKALVDSFSRIFKYKKLTTIFAVKKDKDVLSMLQPLNKITDKFIVTDFSLKIDMGLRLNSEPLSIGKLIKDKMGNTKFEIVPIPEKALKKALKESQKNDAILITGSLYLAGEIRALARQLMTKMP